MRHLCSSKPCPVSPPRLWPDQQSQLIRRRSMGTPRFCAESPTGKSREGGDEAGQPYSRHLPMTADKRRRIRSSHPIAPSSVWIGERDVLDFGWGCLLYTSDAADDL